MKWQVKSKAPSAFFKKFPEYSSLISQLLYNRELKTQEQIDEFFNPDFREDIHDPFLLKGMKKATKRIRQAIEKQEKIFIYGDYDADGVCSTAILYLTMKKLGAKDPGIYIPDRDKEGHGLNKGSIKKLAESGAKLIITVDCASSDIEEVDLANSLGVDVIITDHHQLRDKLPKAISIINPFQKGDQYPFKGMAGAVVAYKLACALLTKEALLKKWLLDLAAIATVADMMPLMGENRTLVKYGLGVLAQTKWLGLRELMKTAQISPKVIKPSSNGDVPVTNLNSHTLAFVLGPRLNAAGRMDHANNAFHLLIAENQKDAEILAKQLNQNNSARQGLTDKIVREIKTRLDKQFDQDKSPKLIFEGSQNWPVGLLGLVAGKISDKYCRPTIIYQEKGDIICASCRGIPQFNLIKMIEESASCFDDFGGHKEAAGFRMKKKNLNKVRDAFVKRAEEKIKDEELVSVLDIDAEVSLDQINWHNYDQIEHFEPFGRFNPKPRFLTKAVEIGSLRTVGNNDNHLKMELVMFDDGLRTAKSFKAIGFYLGKWREELKKGDLIDLVFEFLVDEWNGQRNLQIKIVDLKKTKD